MGFIRFFKVQFFVRYQLVDFGDGRKLESIAGRLIDRPSPAARSTQRAQPELWRQAESVFDETRKRWVHHTPWPDDLRIHLFAEEKTGVADSGSPVIAAKPTPFGHLGIFPEQQDNWRWLIETAPAEHEAPAMPGTAIPTATAIPTDTATTTSTPTPTPSKRSLPKALNLFAYTGVATLVLARSGMPVAHVDAAKPNVQTAREFASANGLGDAAIRYLVDDAAAFVRREIRRGHRYHTIVMDPPAYGHGPKGKPWRLQRDLPPLLSDALDLFTGRSMRLLVTGHSAEMDQTDVLSLLQRKLTNRRIGRLDPIWETGRMGLVDASGRQLDAGFYVRCRVERG